MLSTTTMPVSWQNIFSALLVGVFSLLLIPDAHAQIMRADGTFFVKPRLGLAWHLGDTEKSPFNFNLDSWDSECCGTPYSAAIEFGWQFDQNASLALALQRSNHPLSLVYTPEAPVNDSQVTGGGYTSFQALYRYGSSSRVAPFLTAGAHVTGASVASTTYGPALGAGVDIVVSDRASIVIENISNLSFPDDGFDNTDGGSDGFLSFEVVSALSVGVRISLESAFTPVEILGSSCPTVLGANQAGSFTVDTNAEATQPVNINWDFGDGGMATGMAATHSFASGGMYDVTATVDNGRDAVTAMCSVQVVEAPTIIAIDASDTRFEVCQPQDVTFGVRAETDGSTTYSWDFGDGNTGMGEEVSHTYTEGGTFTVTVTVENEGGSATESITVTALPCLAAICYDITEMNAAYFDRNSSMLTEEGGTALTENADILQQCPNLCGEIVGYAAPGERDAQQLSEERARIVEQFYTENGLAASRFQTEGRGLLPGTTKKEGAQQARRVDTIPGTCSGYYDE